MADIVPVKHAADAKPAADTPIDPQGGPGKRTPKPRIFEAYKQMLLSLFLATLAISLVTIAITLTHYLRNDDKLVEVVSPLMPHVTVYSPGRTDPPLMVILIFAGALG